MTPRHNPLDQAESTAEEMPTPRSERATARRGASEQSAGPSSGTIVQGNVRYPDAAALLRPLDMPRNVRMGLAVALAAAAIVGGIALFAVFDNMFGTPMREQDALEQNIARDVALDLPNLGSLMGLSDADIMTTLSASGATLYEKVPVGTSATEFEVIKLPSDVTLADAGAMYLTGVDNLSPSGAAKLLNGSWDLKVNREAGMNINVRYADFKSGTIEAAIQAALDAEGIDAASIAESGVDDAGNTFAAGKTNVNGTEYNWRVSALELSEVYKVKGMPENTYYVGVRFTA